MTRTLDGLLEEVRQLPLVEQMALIERLARAIHRDLGEEQSLQQEFAAWERLSDEALTHFEEGL